MKSEHLCGLVLCLLATAVWAETPVVTSIIESEADRVPKHTVVPEYPEAAQRRRIEGRVQVCFHITKKGRPYGIAVRTSTNRVFEQPAMRAIKESRYLPLEDDARRSGIKTCRTFHFELTSTADDNAAAQS